MAVKMTEFTTPTCGYCKAIQPFIDMANKSGLVETTEVNVLEQMEAREQYGFNTVPTAVFHEESGDVVIIGSQEIVEYIEDNYV